MCVCVCVCVCVWCVLCALSTYVPIRLCLGVVCPSAVAVTNAGRGWPERDERRVTSERRGRGLREEGGLDEDLSCKKKNGVREGETASDSKSRVADDGENC